MLFRSVSQSRYSGTPMDITLGVPSVIRDVNGALRRKRYGNYGAYRPKSYGVEYRVLSNFWIFNKSNIEWVWDNTAYALELAADKSVDFEPFQEEVEKIINKGDTDAARLFCKTMLPHKFAQEMECSLMPPLLVPIMVITWISFKRNTRLVVTSTLIPTMLSIPLGTLVS